MYNAKQIIFCTILFIAPYFKFRVLLTVVESVSFGVMLGVTISVWAESNPIILCYISK